MFVTPRGERIGDSGFSCSLGRPTPTREVIWGGS